MWFEGKSEDKRAVYKLFTKRSPFILETAVGSQKSAQALDAPGKFEKALITNKVTTRFSNPPITSISCTAFLRPTAVFRLMADVEVVTTYELYNISRTKLENILHRFFESAKLDIQINDRFGNPVIPREWFLVPLFIVDEVVEKIKDGSISEYRYDQNAVKLVKITNK